MRFAIFIIAFYVHCGFSSSVTWAEEPIDFGTQVRPILSDRCFHCHGPDAKNQDSSFRMDSEEALLEAIDRSDLAASEMLMRIHSDDPDAVMPPPDSNRTLSAAEKTILEQWILQGAAYEKHWAFECPKRPEVPQIDAVATTANWDRSTIEAWSSNPIDAFVATKLVANDLHPSPPADMDVLLRRSSLTLTGLLPSATTHQSDNSTSQSAQSTQLDIAIDALLESDAFAERQTLLWLDAARYADTDGYQNDYERHNWPWRDWVIAAYRDNMPFDQFIIEQIAGDMLPDATDMQRLASAFNRNHRQNAESGALAAEYRVENVVDRVETTATVFLGLTMGCARCHDHKYDPLSQKEFFRMYAYFNNIGEKGVGKGVDANPSMKITSPLQIVDDERLARLRQADLAMERDEAKFQQRFKTWIKRMQAVARTNLKGAQSKAKSAAGVTELGKAGAEAATEVEIKEGKADADSDLEQYQKLKKQHRKFLALPKLNDNQKKKLNAHFLTLDPLRRELKAELDSALKDFRDHGDRWAQVMIMRERDGNPEPAYLLQRGQYDQPDKSEALSRGVPEVLLKESQDQPTTRLELARWLVSRDNPLTARVIVNRIWRDHFGTGLVKSTGDFGVQGEVPSHPELLDWLAVEFVESGWDLRAMHRLILTSQTFRQSSKMSAEQHAVDPNNRMLARGPRYRADGFTIRDIALQASGLLNPELGGPAVKPYQPKGLWEVVAADKGTRYRTSTGDSLYRKSMYSYWKRAVNPPRQSIFDAGGRESCSVDVRRTNTPLQALVLMNDQTFIEAARALAETTLRANLASDDQCIADVYRRAIARPIDESTMSVLGESLIYFREHFSTQPSEAEKLLSVGEKRADKTLDMVEYAALTAVAHIVLNLDEFVTIE